VETILRSEGVPEDAIAPAVALSAGRADVALALAQDGAVLELTELVATIDDALHGAGPGTLVELGEQLSRRDDLELTLLTLQSFYRDVSVSALGLEEKALGFATRSSTSAERSGFVAANAAAARVSLIHECLRSIQQSANRQVAIDSLLFSLRNAR
jgi:hypothetical protein